MEICSVSLKNFKVHVDRFFEFRPGTNAICGENGVGKTSILEAIAWVLFDHSDYTRGELIRTGAKSAQVSVSFISSVDGRVYEARRCTSRGYDLFDPQIKANLGLRKLEDVQSWMRQHLGVPPQMDLGRLFAETIGIPQGTFTTDFLKRPHDRKKIFDPILKVEEYRQTYDQMRELETYAKAQVATLIQQLASYEQQLADWSHLQQQEALLKDEVACEEVQMEQLRQDITQHQTKVDQLVVEAEQVRGLEAQLRDLQTQLSAKTDYLARIAADCRSAYKAVELCRAKRANYQAYEAAQVLLQQLNEQRRQQQTALKQRDAVRSSLQDHELEVSQLQGQLAAFTELQRNQSHWQALVPQQDRLEQQLQQLLQALHALEPLKQAKQTLLTQMAQRDALLTKLKAAIATLGAMLPQIEQLPHLEQQQQHLLIRRSQVQAGQAFAQEIERLVMQMQTNRDRHLKQIPLAQQMLVPLLARQPDLVFVQEVLNSGVALTEDVLGRLRELLQTLSDPATQLEDQLQETANQIQALRKLQQRVASLPHQQQQYEEGCRERVLLQQQVVEYDQQLSQTAALQSQRMHYEAELSQLNNPKGQLSLLAQQLQQSQTLRERLSKIEVELGQLQTDLAQKEQALSRFQDLDAQIEIQQQSLSLHQTDHQDYLRNRDQANKFRELEPQRIALEAEQSTLQSNVQQVQAQLQQAQTPDLQQLPSLLQTLEQLKQQAARIQGGLQPKQLQLQDLDRRLKAHQDLAQQQTQNRLQLVQKQQVLQFIVDARSMFNQSGPRITKYYLAEVSHEAEQLFRELLNRDEVTLRWTEDYDIQVQERGYWRSFKSLSGGEQMCAALAVRLALLKFLADVDIAFFDEPTTNMDQLRRQQLAEAISNLKAFRQLFVISHDDTFENVTEHIIRVEAA